MTILLWLRPVSYWWMGTTLVVFIIVPLLSISTIVLRVGFLIFGRILTRAILLILNVVTRAPMIMISIIIFFRIVLLLIIKIRRVVIRMPLMIPSFVV